MDQLTIVNTLAIVAICYLHSRSLSISIDQTKGMIREAERRNDLETLIRAELDAVKEELRNLKAANAAEGAARA